MTIEEAIKILRNYPWGASPDNDARFNQAIQLGIEALKRLKEHREDHIDITLSPLRGETKGPSWNTQEVRHGAH